jgi:hypothetical protein
MNVSLRRIVAELRRELVEIAEEFGCGSTISGLRRLKARQGIGQGENSDHWG